MTHPCLPSPRPHLVAALVTPFTRRGDVDRPSLQRLIHALLADGVDEFFVAGSTGEAPLLDEAQRLSIIAGVRAAAPGALLYAGISGTGHRHALANAADAARAGADVAVLMSPFFLALDQTQFFAYCTAIADACPLPLTLYHHLRMPTPVTVPAIAQLARHPNIIALKDTNGGDHDRCAEVLAATAGRPFRFFQGVEKLVLPSLVAGGHGCVVAQACIAPRLYRALFDAFEAGDLARAEALQRQATALWTIFARREVKQSFYHFLHTLKLPLHRRGLLATTAGAVPGLVFDAGFEDFITAFMDGHLEPPALRSA